MTAKDIIAEFKKLGTAKTKKTWMTQCGAPDSCLGVTVGDMKKIQKRVKMDYQLALDLYDTGIPDVMYFAGLIADDAKMTKKDLQNWIKGANCEWVADFMVPWVASAGPHAREMALKWIESKDEVMATAGWQTYSSMLAIKEDADLDPAEIKSLLQRAAKAIHQQPDRIKWAMNGFVIAVACYFKPLHPFAVETARGIGQLAVAQAGKCNTIPFAPESIKKFEARSPIGKKRKSPKC